MDVVEIDAASNNGVDEIRDLREKVKYPPSLTRYKVYIIDEVHMLSMGAFNALLKTLEEPPEHVLFVLATTEQHKIPATIISRCQRFDFRRITVEDITARLKYIAENENIPLEDEAARLLARQAQGGMRDAINLFELCAGGSHAVTAERVRSVLGITGLENAYKCAAALREGDHESLFKAVGDVVASSKDIAVFWGELVSFWRDMLVAKTMKRPEGYLDLSNQDIELVCKAAERFTSAELIYQANLLDEAAMKMNKMPQTKRNIAELTLIKLSSPELDVSTEALLSRISALEDNLKRLAVSGVRAATKENAADKEAASQTPVSESTSQTQSKPAEKNPEASADKTKTVSQKRADSANSWREITDKSELLERIASANPQLKGFFSEAVCFVSLDKQKVRITSSNPFAVMMMSKPDSVMTITDALYMSGVADVTCDVKIEQGEGRKNTASPMDELDLL